MLTNRRLAEASSKGTGAWIHSAGVPIAARRYKFFLETAKALLRFDTCRGPEPQMFQSVWQRPRI